jgi:hypothetical protein
VILFIAVSMTCTLPKMSAMMTSLTRDIGTLQKAEEERLKDKKTMKFQFTGVAIGFVFQFIIWAIVASNGFKIGGN